VIAPLPPIISPFEFREDCIFDRIFTIVDFSLNINEFHCKNAEGILIKECPTVEEGFKMLAENMFIDQFNKNSNLFMIKIEVKSQMDVLKITQMFAAVRTFAKNDLLILFENFVDKSQVFWKFANGKIFWLNMEPEISTVVVNFLSTCMKNENHTGISQDTLQILSSKLKDEICELDILSLADSRNYNLLMLAAEVGDNISLKSLINCGFDMDILICDNSAAELAWNNRHYETVLLLLEANSLYPKKFNYIESTEALKKFVNKTRDLHNMIRKKRDLSSILDQNINLRHFYNTANLSAPAQALLCENIEMYKELLSKNIYIGPKEDFDKLIRKLSDNKREHLRGIHLYLIQSWTEKHLMILISNSFVGHDIIDVGSKLQHVRNAFEFLNKFPLITLILKVVAASRDFKIIFDFNRSMIQHLDPTSGKYTKGSFFTTRHIYIAAQQLLETQSQLQVYGTLAHELCHYALLLVYNNNCKPYPNSEENKTLLNKFSQITSNCEENKHAEILIQYVFEYNSCQQHAELAVRVPHMIVEYSNDKKMIATRRENFPELFKFIENETANDMEEALATIQIKADVKMKKYTHRMKSKNRQIVWLWILSAFLILMVPLAALITMLVFNTSNPIYTCANLTDKVRPKVFGSTVNFQGVPIIFSELFGKNLTACNVIDTNEIGQIIKAYDSNQFIANVYAEQRNFTAFKKLEVPEKYCNGSLELINNTEFLEEYKDKEFRNFSLIIGEKIELRAKFYIKRKLKVVIEENSNKTFNDNQTSPFVCINSKIHLLSDTAGSGKSTTFRYLTWELKQKFPLKWVSFIDLKNHAIAIKELPKLDPNLTTIAEFLALKILKLTIEAEKKIFNEKFTKNQAIFLWDGVDEISPYCFNETLRLIQDIWNMTENYQWISTRPQHEKIIADRFKIPILKIEPYNESDRQEFATKFMNSKNFTEDQVTEALEKVLNFVINLEDRSISKEYNKMVNNPQMLYMICNAYVKNISLDNSTNIYTFYDSYIGELFDIADRHKGDIVRNDTKVIQMKQKFQNIHHFYAIKTILESMEKNEEIFDPNFNLNSTYNLNLLKQNFSSYNEEISRYGILFFNDQNQLEFEHRTFAEFFIAQFIYVNIYDFTYDMSRHEAEMRLKFLFNLMVRHIDHEIIFDFMNGFLNFHESSSVPFHPLFVEIIKENYTNLIIPGMHSRMEDPRSNFMFGFSATSIKLVTPFFKKDENLLYLLWKIDENETVFHRSFKNFELSTKFDEIVKIVEENFSKENQKKIFLGKFQAINMLLKIKSGEYSCAIAKYLDEDCQKIINIQNESKFADLINAKNYSNSYYQILIDENGDKIFQKIDSSDLNFKIFWKVLENKHEVLKSWFWTRGTRLFHLLYRNKQFVESFLIIIEKFLNQNEIIDLILHVDKRRFTFMYQIGAFSPDVDELLWSFIEKHLNKELQKQLFAPIVGRTVASMIYLKIEKLFVFYQHILQMLFSNDELQIGIKNGIFEYIKARSYYDEYDVPQYLKLTKFIQEVYKGNNEDLKKLFLVKDTSNISFLQIIFNETGQFNPLKELARSVFNETEIKQLSKARITSYRF